MPREIEIPILIVLIIITGYFYIKERKKSYEAAKALDEKMKAEKEETEFLITAHIEGMMCEKCASKVMEALLPFGEITVDIEEKTATVKSKELPDAEEIKAAIEKLGYSVTNIE